MKEPEEVYKTPQHVTSILTQGEVEFLTSWVRSTIVRRHRGNWQFQGKVYDCSRSYDHDLERNSPGLEQANPAALGDSRLMRRSLLSSSFSQQAWRGSENSAPSRGISFVHLRPTNTNRKSTLNA